MPRTVGHDLPEILDQTSLCAKAAGIDIPQALELADFAAGRGESLISVMVSRGVVDERALIRRLADLLEMPSVTEATGQISADTLRKISPALAASYQVIPLDEREGALRVACWDPFNWQDWDDLAHLVGLPLEKVLCPRTIIQCMIKANYGLGAHAVDRLTSAGSDDAVSSVEQAVTDLSEEDAANEPTVVDLVNQILTEAIRANATDIHLEPFENRYRVRYRIDGMLEDVPMPASLDMLKQAVVSRTKIMSRLDITEKRLPQDGRAQVSLAGQKLDLRVSILPGVYGEAVVVRIQNRQNVPLDLTALGFGPGERQKIDHLISRSYGLVLVTGPTGSGKTTTLYTCLSKIRSPENKIITIEDPVEYWMDDIVQMQVNDVIGFTFARALRSMLRHDPDIMLVGEIRDRETADMSIRSALTGHLVFATLHTNSAASAIARLCDIGIEPFLLASSLQGILAQRLVRRICNDCKSEAGFEELDDSCKEMLRKAGYSDDMRLWRGRGCPSCRFTGYSGRMAAGEVMWISPAIRRLIQERQPADRIEEKARNEGTRSLRDNLLVAVESGLTTPAEALRVTQEDI